MDQLESKDIIERMLHEEIRRQCEKIERLTAENARLREALDKISKLDTVYVFDFNKTDWEHQRIARAALAEQEKTDG